MLGSVKVKAWLLCKIFKLPSPLKSNPQTFDLEISILRIFDDLLRHTPVKTELSSLTNLLERFSKAELAQFLSIKTRYDKYPLEEISPFLRNSLRSLYSERDLEKEKIIEDLKAIEKVRINGANSISLCDLLSYSNFSSFGQEGEDIILDSFFADQKEGFFVDIGAFHPTWFSNTVRFYNRGWSGINVEPTPGSKKKFDTLRPRDVNIECAVGSEEKPMELFAFSVGALNTTDEKRAREIEEKTSIEVQNIHKIPVRTMTSILSEHSENRVIDFLSIDVEKKEYSVIASNDWERFRPKVIAMEALQKNYDDCDETNEVDFLLEREYLLVYKLPRTLFFVDRNCELMEGRQAIRY